MTTLAELQQLAQNPNVRKMLDLISYTEHTQNNGYYTAFGGSRLSSLADHPRYQKQFRQTDGRMNTTSAAGRYQFLRRTWDGLARQYGFKDFSPQNQDLGAVALLIQRGAMPHLLKGDFANAIAKSGAEWASLPTSPHPQPTKSWKQVNAFLGGNINIPQQRNPQPTFQDPTAGMDSFQLVAYLRKANKRLTDNQIFEVLANNQGIAGREVRGLLATGQLDPRDIAKTLGLKKTSFAPEVTTYFDNLKKSNPVKAAQPIRQPSPQKTFLSSAVDDFFTSQSKPTEEANTSKNQFSIAGAVDDYFAKGSSQAPANLEGDSTSQDNKSFLGSAIDDFFTTSSQAQAQPSQQPQVPQVQAQPHSQAQQPTEQAVPTLQAPSLYTFVSAKQPTIESDLATGATNNNNDYANNVMRFGLQA